LVEGVVISGYSFWCKKPLAPILLTSLLANLSTQSLLWIALQLFFQRYLIALLISEVFIWLIEGFLLYRFPANQLSLREAIFLSLLMNTASLSLGWFLPV
jgi:hypothetical protein